MYLQAILVPFQLPTSPPPPSPPPLSPRRNASRNVARRCPSSSSFNPAEQQQQQLQKLTVGSGGVTLNKSTTGISLSHDLVLEWAELNRKGRLIKILTLKAFPAKAKVTVNGMPSCYGCRLRDGDVLNFFGVDGIAYKYKIQIRLHTTRSSKGLNGQTASMKRPANDISSTLDTNSPKTNPATCSFTQAIAPALEEFNCVVCMEVQVKSTTLVPCGHSFCRDCAPALRKGNVHQPTLPLPSCPVCRAPITQQVPNRTVDNAIASLINCDGLFNPDDVTVYRTRTGTSHCSSAIPPPPINYTTISINDHSLRRRRLQSVHVGVGSTSDDAICLD